jgi:hypothetical protein
VIEVESRAVLNTLTEHDFQDAFNKIVGSLGTVNIADGDNFEGDV